MADEEKLAGCQVITANKIKIGKFMIMNENRPCRVVEATKSKPGKHGTAKIRFVGMDIFTNKKYDYLSSSGSTVQVPEVSKTEWKIDELTPAGMLKLSRELRPGETNKLDADADANAEEDLAIEDINVDEDDAPISVPKPQQEEPKAMSKKELRKLKKARKAGGLTEEEETAYEKTTPMVQPEETKMTHKEIKCPKEELGEKIQAAVAAKSYVIVSILSSMGIESVWGMREVRR